ncbi:MAG: hypothetical protein IT456_24045 [Planctomycetes bacterium]|nr:hypothetical protein [Planctomycetota bacterium]
MAEITEALNITERTAYRELARAEERGWLDVARKRMQETADKAPLVLDTILDADPSELQKNHKGYALKSEVARELMKGMGVFSPEQKKTTTVNLNNWHAQQAAAPTDPAAPLDAIDIIPYEHDTPQIGDPRPEPATRDDGRRDDGAGDPDQSGESW